MSEMGNSKIKNFGIGLGFGLLIGVIVAFLTAPRKGSETRKLVRNKVVNIASSIKDKLPKKKTS